MEISDFHPFISAQAREAYLNHYDQRAKEWPVDSETRMVDTFLGQTFVRISGPTIAAPLVLLPGSVFNSLMWIPNIEAFSQHYRTYAVDNIYDCGRSIYTREPKKPEDFVSWLDELFTVLELGNHINILGLSYGSWLAHRYALHHPDRLAKVVLMGHPAIVSPNIEFTFRFLSSIVSPRQFRAFVNWLFYDTSMKDENSIKIVDALFHDMKLAGKSFKPKKLVIPKVMKDEEFQNIKIPTLFLIGENEKTFNQQKAVQRLEKFAPQINTEIIPAAGHDLNYAQSDLVNQKVLAFLQ